MNLRRISALLLALVLVCSTASSAQASSNEDTYISRMINYFEYYGEDAAIDIAYLNQQLAATDPDRAAGWAKIMDFWAQCTREMDLTQEVLPDGLPEDDSLCIVVLGYCLVSDGSMHKELIGRLETALAAAEKYPNAYIACTGGGTASGNRCVTEAGQMAAWLMDHGIDESRIIKEDKSLSTIENAQFTTALLSAEYPQIQNLVVVTSDYHVFRGCLYFYTDSVLNAIEGTGIAYNVVGHAVYRTGQIDSADVHTQAEGLTILGNVCFFTKKQSKLSTLDHIAVSGPAQWPMGTELDLTVTAVYTNGYEQDVTIDANYSGFDLAKAGLQTVAVSYTAGDKTYTAHFNIELLPTSTEAPAAAEVLAPTEAAVPTVYAVSEEVSSVNSPAIPLPVLLGMAGILLLALGVLLVLKSRRK